VPQGLWQAPQAVFGAPHSEPENKAKRTNRERVREPHVRPAHVQGAQANMLSRVSSMHPRAVAKACAAKKMREKSA
jgi:hypothetical protein